MVVNSIDFLIFFIVVFLIYYFPLKEKTKAQNIFLLLVSYFFYGYADWKMLPLLIVATVVYYFMGLGILFFNRKGRRKNGYAVLASGIVLGIGMLLYFKYVNFFITSFSQMFESLGLHTNVHTFNIVLPLGISFFTFRLISYLIEINRGMVYPTRNIVTFGLYVAFFPCLLSGPIDRPQNLIPQLKAKRCFNYEMAVDGLRQVLWGMFKKMVVADNLAVSVNYIWSDYANQSGSSLLLGVFFFSFQMYADFSGYSDMAIGTAKVLGFNVTKNFNYPYFARNISEFWSRWHMSLTTCFTNYIYIPLGGNQRGRLRQFFNIMVVFTVCGLWHGAGWNFVLWGLYNGVLFLPLVLKKRKKYTAVVAKGRLFPDLQDALRMVSTFLLINLGWVMLRADSVVSAYDYLAHIFNASLFTVPANNGMPVIYILLFVIVEWIQRDREYPLQIECTLKHPALKWSLYYVFIFVILFFSGRQSQFIYFQF